jgi:hypothetical protein
MSMSIPIEPNAVFCYEDTEIPEGLTIREWRQATHIPQPSIWARFRERLPGLRG